MTFKWQMWDGALGRLMRSGRVRVPAPSEFETWRVTGDVSRAAQEMVAARVALGRIRLSVKERRAIAKGDARLYVWRSK
jgi:hypothetical protein